MLEQGAVGKELILDIHNTELSMMSKDSLDKFFVLLCDRIDMTRTELFYWEYDESEKVDEESYEHLKGWSAVQFIKTSNVTVHTFDGENKVSINLFSCKDFDEEDATSFCLDYFRGSLRNKTVIPRF